MCLSFIIVALVSFRIGPGVTITLCINSVNYFTKFPPLVFEEGSDEDFLILNLLSRKKYWLKIQYLTQTIRYNVFC